MNTGCLSGLQSMCGYHKNATWPLSLHAQRHMEIGNKIVTFEVFMSPTPKHDIAFATRMCMSHKGH